MHKILSLLLAFFISAGISSCFSPQSQSPNDTTTTSVNTTIVQTQIDENGFYTDKENVALYIHTFEHLPGNYITKSQAQSLGWDSKKGNLAEVAPGKSIGGDKFSNYEGLLPKDKNLKYFECDIDYKKGKRNAKRIIYSNKGTIYYTKDHYKSFEQLY